MNDAAGSPEHRTPFAPETIRTGAVISFSREKLVVGGDGIIGAIESRLTDGSSAPERRDQWLADGVPVLSRGDAWIIPLSWQPASSEADSAERQILSGRANELWMAVRSACWYRHGDTVGIDLSSEDGERNRYVAELLRTGARRAGWWEFGDRAVVLVVYGEPLPAPPTLMAVHVVPVGWVSENRPAKKIPPTDLGWSWTDVVALAGADDSGASAATGSVGDVHEEEQGS